jgi:hypothetical protein
MRNANTQTMPKILVINDWMPPLQESTESLIHWDFPEEDEPCGKLSLSCGEWGSPSDEQEWQDDYTQSIRL